MSDMMLRELYEETLLDHNRHPRNFKHHPAGANREAHGHNPVCGDDITLYLSVEDGVIKDLGFEGQGCAISTASASLMTEALKGKRVAEAQQLFEQMHTLLTAEQAPTGAAAELGKLKILQGVRAYPMRVKCATLAWHTLQAALADGDTTVTTE